MKKYPYFVEVDLEKEGMPFHKNFDGSLCHVTGRVRIDGPESGDSWYEYIHPVSEELHYGR